MLFSTVAFCLCFQTTVPPVFTWTTRPDKRQFHRPCHFLSNKSLLTMSSSSIRLDSDSKFIQTLPRRLSPARNQSGISNKSVLLRTNDLHIFVHNVSYRLCCLSVFLLSIRCAWRLHCLPLSIQTKSQTSFRPSDSFRSARPHYSQPLHTTFGAKQIIIIEMINNKECEVDDNNRPTKNWNATLSPSESTKLFGSALLHRFSLLSGGQCWVIAATSFRVVVLPTIKCEKTPRRLYGTMSGLYLRCH